MCVCNHLHSPYPPRSGGVWGGWCVRGTSPIPQKNLIHSHDGKLQPYAVGHSTLYIATIHEEKVVRYINHLPCPPQPISGTGALEAKAVQDWLGNGKCLTWSSVGLERSHHRYGLRAICIPALHHPAALAYAQSGESKRNKEHCPCEPVPQPERNLLPL